VAAALAHEWIRAIPMDFVQACLDRALALLLHCSDSAQFQASAKSEPKQNPSVARRIGLYGGCVRA
jgi:hypothetical protein